MKRTLFAATLLAAGALAWSPEAKADLVSIGLQETGVNGGRITTVGAAVDAAGSLTLDYGSFIVSGSLAQASSSSSALLDSASLSASTGAAGTLHVWITVQGLTGPAGLGDVSSLFTAGLMLGSVASISEETFYSAADARYGTTTPLSSTVFTQAGSTTGLTPVDFTGGLFVITEEYTIVLTGAGIAAGSIDVSDPPVPAVPEPGSLLLLGTALLAFGVSARARPLDAWKRAHRSRV